ncbi:hypothetical protein L3Y34_016422 [Caenorhabditis briggsae]|uniref:F-box domain-containing protein n=1 Tax=Caenorhabditis briggsae TaxID=6238 RepID=A0AAE9J0N7_CAEBR|nr:hypothetical protein L3Y34_016422 [Caenorhabditis briggsae]
MTFPPNPENSSDEIHKIAFLPSENDENLPEFQSETPENLGEWDWRFQRNLKYVDEDFELFDDDGKVIKWTEFCRLTDLKKGKFLKNEKSPEMLYKKTTPRIPNILKNSRSQNAKILNSKCKTSTSGDRREIQNRTPKMYPVRVLDQENSRSQNQNLNPADHIRTLHQRNSGNSGNLQYPGNATTAHRTLQNTQNQNQNRNPSNPAPRRQNQQQNLWFPQKTKYPVRVLAQGNQPDPPKYYFPETGTSEKLEKPYFRCTPLPSPPNSDAKTKKKIQSNQKMDGPEKIRIQKLPKLVSKMVFDELEIIDLFTLSILSRKMKKIISEFKFKIPQILWLKSSIFIQKRGILRISTSSKTSLSVFTLSLSQKSISPLKPPNFF